MTSPTIEIDLGSALERIEQSLADFRQETNQKLDNLNKEVTDLKIGQARIEGDIKVLDSKLTGVEKEVSELKGTTKNQLWSLIVLLAGTLLTVGAKVFIFPGNP